MPEGEKITAPLPLRATKEEELEVDEEQGPAESLADALHHNHVDNDLWESTPGVGTDGDFLPTASSSDSRADELDEPAINPIVAPGGEVEARGPRARRGPVYDNNYFYIPDNEGYPDVNMYAHTHWTAKPPLGLGTKPTCSKTVTPTHYGETRENPVRSWMLLRGWMSWRATREGWAARAPGRCRLFADEAARLERDIQRLQPQTDGVLGHKDATRKLEAWVPDIVARLRQ